MIAAPTYRLPVESENDLVTMMLPKSVKRLSRVSSVVDKAVSATSGSMSIRSPCATELRKPRRELARNSR
jgi:hypothetical protein